MSTFQTALSWAPASKAEMYGFPLIVWPSGALQSHRFGVPGSRSIDNHPAPMYRIMQYKLRIMRPFDSQ